MAVANAAALYIIGSVISTLPLGCAGVDKWHSTFVMITDICVDVNITAFPIPSPFSLDMC